MTTGTVTAPATGDPGTSAWADTVSGDVNALFGTMAWNHIGDLGSTFGTSCTDNDPSETNQYRVAFAVDGLGFVHMRGALTCSASKAAAFSVIKLPAGFRSLKQKVYNLTVLNNVGAQISIPIQQNPSGDYVLVTAIGTAFQIFFDSVVPFQAGV